MNRLVSFCIWILTVACLAIVPAIRCSLPPHPQQEPRTVHVRAIVDPEIAARDGWQKKIQNIFANVDTIMRPWAQVTFVVDTVFVWDCDGSKTSKDMLLGDCLVKEQPKGKSDIVIYFDKRGFSPPLIDAMPLYEQGYAYIRMPPPDDQDADLRTSRSLLHWIGHMFGAVHCYYDKDNVMLMNPFIHEGVICAGDTIQPKFHEGNGVIMTALSLRPFTEDAWSASQWPGIRAAYDLVHRKFNPVKIEPGSGELTDYERDAFHEGNLLLYKSSWASLCGRHDEALGYLDTLEALYCAIKRTCVKEGIVGKTRLCSICGYDAVDAANWLDLQKFYISMRRAMLLLRKGDFASSDSCFGIAMRIMPSQIAMVKEKYQAGYAFYRDRSLERKATAQTRKHP